MKKVGIVLDNLYTQHETIPGHPECPERIIVIKEMLRETGLINEVIRVPARDASRDEILLIHTPEYFHFIESTRDKMITMLDPDTSTSPRSFDAALRATGGVLSLIECVFNKDIDIDTAFAFVRPPGHHAETERAMGFCLFNNIAIGTAYAIQKYGLNRILIVDWDVHHGNGTQNAFYKSNQVLFFSIHQYPFYPGTGNYTEIGAEKGKGYTVNIPLSPGMGNKEYIKILFEILKPIADELRPELILVSAGFDAHTDDPLAGMKLSQEGFAQMTRFLKETAETYCTGKLVLTLEGGYSFSGLQSSTKAVLEELLEKTSTPYPYHNRKEETFVDTALSKIKKIQSTFWKL